jgi:outer membrane immunogenic protein
MAAAVSRGEGMNRFVVGAMALAAVGCAGTAQGADFGYAPHASQTVMPPLNYSWFGPYLGGTLGYEWGSVGNNPTKPSGITGGVEAGYNWQNGSPWVFGVEGDINLTGADDTFAPWKFSNPWFGTLRGRAGYAFNNILFYGTGGLAFGELKGLTFGGVSESHTTAGWTLGAGAEFGLAQNWSAKIEYLYVDLDNSNFVVTGAKNDYRFGLVRAGINFHF